MNKDRRKRIDQLVAKLEELGSEAEELIGDEQDYFDNMPESLRGGEKGQVAENAIEYLTTAKDSIDEAVSSLNEAGNS